MKKLTNEDVLLLGKQLSKEFTYFSFNLRYVRDYDVQKCIEDNEPNLIAESKKITDSLVNTFGPNWKIDDLKVREILDRESTLKLSTIELTETQMRTFQPNWDAKKCLNFIVTIKK
jgi:hypothetical protein